MAQDDDRNRGDRPYGRREGRDEGDYRDYGRPEYGYEGEEYAGRDLLGREYGYARRAREPGREGYPRPRRAEFEEGAGGYVEPYRDRRDERESRRGPYEGGGFHRDEGGFGPEQYGRDYGQDFGYGRRDRSDETYGVGDYGAQGYAEAYGRRGALGGQAGGGRNRHGVGEYDPFYHQWREEQLRRLDQDYEEWRRERQTKFNEEFERWREERRTRQAGEAESREEPESKKRG